MPRTDVPRDADPQLAARVRTELGTDTAGPLSVLEGGRSGLTYRIDAGALPLVIKAVPPGREPIGRNDVLRQSHVLSALAGSGLPVPAVVARSDEAPAWFAMEFAAGEASEPVLDPTGGADQVLSRLRMLAAARVLGALHAVPLDTLTAGITAAGGTPPEVSGPADELARWTRTMEAVPEDVRPGATALLDRLAASVPGPVAPVLVHGDFRLGNLLCVGTTPTALVDWEIWGLGDPRVDLGWFGVFTDGSLFPGVGSVVSGLSDPDELAEAYRAARGEDGGTADDMSWFHALGRLKMAAIMGHNLRRHREGRHHDPVQEQLPPTILALIASAAAILDGEPS
ncbi:MULTISPECIES: phosphotransferase family protein [Pseudonocardia]|uniref:Aminoglycoside phosphotransferase n=2 Tax=Pseudonocardia TaxID=1847 RepID=A0ABQ0RZ44_9PSEU|nr:MULTISPECIES: phosphotransferase family protein [Pseudonocardia]OSY37060.1 putative aminoglycoside phosphotransferase [Pseudonocardia autotrophica]TDN72033.1 streptomycin 6-kinase [Pseudonocardia autotrophica]BBG02728.1 aminoglycoside phosphotransferase [Pseudonocardia autotrophica]GEC25939.1 aminoglycoside phosphotransferase [Pseudonocardia saturnea]